MTAKLNRKETSPSLFSLQVSIDYDSTNHDALMLIAYQKNKKNKKKNKEKQVMRVIIWLVYHRIYPN